MQPSERTVSLRRALLAVAVVLSVVGGISIASAATADRHARPAAGKAQAPAGAVGSQCKAPAGAVRSGGKAPAGAVRSRGKAPAGAVRYHGHVVGLVAPLSARQRGVAVRGRASRSAPAARPLACGRVTVVGRSLKARVMASALLDP